MMTKKNDDLREGMTRELGLQADADINAIRQAVVSQEFRNHIGERVLVLIEQYPFLIIGTIRDVVSDFVLIKAEVTNVSELDGELFRIHTDEIDVFFIEDGVHQIPDIRDNFC